MILQFSLTALLTLQGPVDWATFLARQDLVWDRLPTGWGESAFIGNGRLGATIDVRDSALGWTINRTDVVHDQSRYPIGRVVLKTAGTVQGGSARLVLWDAEASGTVTTDRGEVRWRSFTASRPSVIVIVLEGTGGESGVALDWAPADARTATAEAVRQGVARLEAAHRRWWHAYYPESFLTFPDARLEAYYWIQIYKLGSAMRPDGPILDLNGPWFNATPWPGIWWNLNIQLTYSPLFRANRLDLAESLLRNLDRH